MYLLVQSWYCNAFSDHLTEAGFLWHFVAVQRQVPCLCQACRDTRASGLLYR